MTPQIKKRIEQIRRGEVPEGYKKTNVGIVPAEWEITRFKKKFDRLMRKNTEGNTNVLTISAQFGLVNQEEFFNKSVASDDKSNYYLLHRGEYAYNKSYSNGYPFGAIKRLDKYDKGAVSPLYICFSANEGNKCPEFYLQYFEAGKLNSEIHAFAQEGARNHGLLNISVEDFFNSILLEPPLPEQKKIAEILKTQDRVIELYEEKIEQLKKLKKVFLQKLFPKLGASVPEWRFPEFTAPWEQRKLIEICEQVKDTVDPQLTPDKTFYEYSMPAFDDNSEPNIVSGYEMNSIRKVINVPCLLINKLNVRKRRIWLVEKPENNAVCSAEFVPVTSDISNLRFLKYVALKDDFSTYLEDCSSGSSNSQKRVTPDVIMKATIQIPTIDEQSNIGTFFTNIDSLITLHQRKCDEEKQKKKALMQLLLTGIVRVKT